MEEDTGLELSLGLSCGGSSGKLKDKDGNFSDAKSEEGGNNNKVIGDLKNFLNSSIQKQDKDDGSQRNDLAHAGLQSSKENFFTNLGRSAPIDNASTDLHGIGGPPFTTYGGLWDANEKSTDIEEVKSTSNDMGNKMRLEASNKRKMFFDDMNHQKKHEREDAHGKSPSMINTSLKTSHISVTTEDGSTAENEDVAESEVEGSTSRLVLHHDVGLKQSDGPGGASSEANKEGQGQRQSVPPRNEPKHGNLNFGTSLPLMTESYSFSSKALNVNGESTMSGFSLSSMMQVTPSKNNEGSQPMNLGSLPLTFGYSPVQLPTLDTDRAWGSGSHPSQVPPSFTGRSMSSAVPNSDRSEDVSKLSRENKIISTEEGGASSSSQIEGNRSNKPLEGYPHEGSAIRQGLAAGLKFGGCGTRPDLPWVSVTGTGPNGKTISGVTYKFDSTQVKIVCACHGSHMSPEEFVQHANGDQQNPENDTGLTSFLNGNPAASARN